MRKYDIVVTTIFEPAWLTGYLENIRAHGHIDAVTVRIICDRKTPAGVYEAAAQASAQGFAIDCPDLDEQVSYLKRLGVDDEFIPWNTDNRRNIGFLRAWEAGADVLVSIDDDNYCRPEPDFIGSHAVVGRPSDSSPGVQLASGSEWLNVCALLDGDYESTIYPRGYPYSARADGQRPRFGELPAAMSERVVAVNAGLWLDDPDVDAITRLAVRPRVDRAEDRDLILAPDTWTPINTQNTAIHRAAIPAYYYVRMGFPLQGMRIDRFGDIWSGYFLQACAHAVGEAVRVGSPVADHRRTTHNLFVDLYQELAGIVVTEELIPWLRELRLSASGYADAYAELAEAISSQADRFSGFVWDEGGREFLASTAEHMRTWLGAVSTLSSE